jgi:tetratricopeptide (TPR) repeat protein
MPPDLQGLRREAEAAYLRDEFGAAERLCRQLISIKPDESLAHLLLANLATAAGRHRLAVRHALAAAADLAGFDTDHVCAVGLKLISVGETGRACDVLRAIDSQNATGPQRVAISRQFSMIDEHRLSLEPLLAAEKAAGGDEKIQYLIGNALKFLGDIAGAAARYERCIDLNSRFAFAHWSLAYLGKAYNAPAHVTRLRAELARAGLGEANRVMLDYALFKELDAAGDFSAAWSALERGSATKNRTVVYDAEVESAIYDQVIAGYDRLPETADDDGAAERPLFIVGMPRTGTTLLERILGAQASVAICGELNDLRMQFKWSSDHYCPGFFDATAARRISVVDHTQLGRRYLDHVRWRLGSSRVFTDKNPGNFVMAGTILRALPNARILHLSRDPMDSCFSNLKELFAANSYPYSYRLGNLAAHHRNYSRLMRHWRTLAPQRILDVRYESLVSEPATVAREVMAFCGLEFDAGQLRIEDSQRPVSTASSAQVREPIHGRFVGAWKNYAEPLAPLARQLAE